jgi:hypothetical protein
MVHDNVARLQYVAVALYINRSVKFNLDRIMKWFLQRESLSVFMCFCRLFFRKVSDMIIHVPLSSKENG